MKTFKSHLTESTSAGLHQLIQMIDEYIATGEIVKPRFAELKRKVDYFIEKAYKTEVTDKIGRTYRYYLDANIKEMEDLVYGGVYGMQDLKRKAKLVKLVKPADRNDAVYNIHDKWINEHMLLVDKMNTLKTMVVTTAAKRAEVKAAKEVILKKQFRDSSTLIAVLNMHIEEYKARAKKMAEEQYENAMKQLRTVDWDLDILAPQPSSNMSTANYRLADSKRSWFRSMTESDEVRRKKYAAEHNMSPYANGIPYYRKESSTLKAQRIEIAVKGAEASYHAWVAKMIQKIGKPVVDAKMTGNPWTGSVLKVTCNDGEEQVWNNKMIINQSKYALMFNQFPSRRVK